MTTTITYHILQHGEPFCKFSDKVPSEWPEGHMWTHVEDYGHINCPVCREEMKKIYEQNKK